jgi:hypothetical protein
MRTGRASVLVWSMAAACGGPHHVFAVEPRLAVQTTQHLIGPMETSSNDVLVIADTHAGFPFSRHATVTDSVGFGDTFVTHVAVRPAQMDMWGPSVLRWLTREQRDVGLILHLGDAANTSCNSELSRFATVMRDQPRPWVMAPGNHDSLMMGNFGEGTLLSTGWDEACALPTSEAFDPDGQPDHMNKNSFIASYLAAQGWTLSGIPDAPACEDAGHVAPPIMRVHVCLDPGRPHRSYILQQVELGAAAVFVIDTTAFPVSPDVTRYVGGKVGATGADQLAVLRRWMTDETTRGTSAFVIAGHFPLDAVDHASADGLSRLIADFPVMSYWSAHTHDSTMALYHPRPGAPRRAGDRGTEFLEINFGSVLDWPMEYSRVRLSRQPAVCAGCRRWGLELQVLDIAAALDCPASWRISDQLAEHEPDARYTSYKASFLRSYVWFLGDVAYDQLRENMYKKLYTHLGISLSPDEIAREAEERQPHETPVLDRYERCQVRWASEAESGTRSGFAGHHTIWDPPTRSVSLHPQVQPDSLRAQPSAIGHWLWQWN